jgi:hypothetical protein
MLHDYNYSILSLPNQRVDLLSLSAEIRAFDFSPSVFEHASAEGDNLSVWFTLPMSVPLQTDLDTIVYAHQGIAQPDSSALGGFGASTDPGVTDDYSKGARLGSRWVNTSSNQEWVCLNSDLGAAVWKITTNTTTASTAPSDITKSPAVIGSSADAAKADHKHDVSTAAASSLSAGGSNTEGSSTSLARSDHLHALPAFGSTSGTFCQGDDSRLSDDRTSSGLRSATTIVVVSSATAPSAGQVLTATSTTTADWQTPTGGGVSTSRVLTAGAGLTGGGDLTADRTFNVAANADGSITVNADDIQVGVLATDDQHGTRGGGTIHAAATTSVNGFMSSTDKTKINQFIPGTNSLTISASAPGSPAVGDIWINIG